MTQTPAPPPPAPKPRPSLHLNWQDWLPYLEHISASDAEKQRLIETIWQIMHAFVDLGWDLDAGAKTSGQSLDLTAALQAAVLYSESSTPKTTETV